jgi:uncharacterized protein (DUF924 family)
MANLPSADEVLNFWFSELTPAQWFSVDVALDERVRERFLDLHTAACAAELFEWRANTQGRLAEILVLDQFSRNLYRGLPRAFAADGLALGLAQEAVRLGCDLELSIPRRNFLYLPYMHSESLRIHQSAEPLFARAAEHTADYERRHRVIIERFGRYPHRNAILGRPSTAAEAEFLAQPGSSF